MFDPFRDIEGLFVVVYLDDILIFSLDPTKTQGAPNRSTKATP